MDNKQEISAKVIRQLEYYFGDINLPRDKFLLSEIERVEDGWIPIDTLLKFNRLAQISKDKDFIASCVAESKSELLEVNENKDCIRRNPQKPVPEQNEEVKKDRQSRTVYAKGFPKLETTIDDVIEFAVKFGPTEQVTLRKYKDLKDDEFKFKGSIFICYKNKEDAQKFLDEENLKFGDNELLRMWQEEYFRVKKMEKMESKSQVKMDKAVAKYGEELALPKGALMRLSELSEGTYIADIKSVLVSLGWNVGYIEFPDDKKHTTHVRLNDENSAKEVVAKLPDGVLKIKEKECKIEILEGEEEEKILKQMWQDRVLKRRVFEMRKKQQNAENRKERYKAKLEERKKDKLWKRDRRNGNKEEENGDADENGDEKCSDDSSSKEEDSKDMAVDDADEKGGSVESAAVNGANCNTSADAVAEKGKLADCVNGGDCHISADAAVQKDVSVDGAAVNGSDCKVSNGSAHANDAKVKGDCDVNNCEDTIIEAKKHLIEKMAISSEGEPDAKKVKQDESEPIPN